VRFAAGHDHVIGALPSFPDLSGTPVVACLREVMDKGMLERQAAFAVQKL
jgi:hypothetical protein